MSEALPVRVNDIDQRTDTYLDIDSFAMLVD